MTMIKGSTFDELIDQLEDHAELMINHLHTLQKNGVDQELIKVARNDMMDIFTAIYELRDDSSNLDDLVKGENG